MFFTMLGVRLEFENIKKKILLKKKIKKLFFQLYPVFKHP